MGLIVTSKVRIGDEYRSPGYRLTELDLVGRNVDSMKAHGHVKYVDDDEPRRGPGRPRKETPAEAE